MEFGTPDDPVHTLETFQGQEAFHLVAYDANLPLDEDSEQEAYQWLDIFVKNVDSPKSHESVLKIRVIFFPKKKRSKKPK